MHEQVINYIGVIFNVLLYEAKFLKNEHIYYHLRTFFYVNRIYFEV